MDRCHLSFLQEEEEGLGENTYSLYYFTVAIRQLTCTVFNTAAVLLQTKEIITWEASPTCRVQNDDVTGLKTCLFEVMSVTPVSPPGSGSINMWSLMINHSADLQQKRTAIGNNTCRKAFKGNLTFRLRGKHYATLIYGQSVFIFGDYFYGSRRNYSRIYCQWHWF